ncbi:MAG: hypothetical protein WDO74_17060 [Pseudomonadota bacterium]
MSQANQHQHQIAIASLKDKVQRLGSRKDDAARFARAWFKAQIKRAQDRLAAYREADAAYGKVHGELVTAQTAFDQKRAELLAAVETELGRPSRGDSATQTARARGTSRGWIRSPWSYNGASTEELVHKALHDPNGNHGANLGEFIGHRRTLSPGDMALAILGEDQYAAGSAVWNVEKMQGRFREAQEAFEVRWQVWASANREAIAAVGA